MKQNYSYRNYPYIGKAMKAHNNITTGTKFTLMDFNILCFVKSFHDAGQKFYINNEQLANSLVSCEKTVRNSINRLCKFGFLEKKQMNNSTFHGRYLIYNDQAVNKFIEEADK